MVFSAGCALRGWLWFGWGGNQVAALVGHESLCKSVAVSGDGGRAVTGSMDATARVWTLTLRGRAVECKHVLRGHADGVECVALSSDGGVVATASLDRTARVWSSDTAATLHVLAGHEGMVWGVGFLNGVVVPRQVVTCAHDGKLRVWSGREAEVVRMMEGFSYPPRFVACASSATRNSPVAGMVAVGMLDNFVWMCNAGNGSVVARLDHGCKVITAALAGNASGVLVVGLENGDVCVWRATQRVEEMAVALLSGGDANVVSRFLRNVDGDHAMWSRVVGFLEWVW